MGDQEGKAGIKSTTTPQKNVGLNSTALTIFFFFYAGPQMPIQSSIK